MEKVGILGAGTWGVVFADLLVNNGNDVTVWSRDKKQVDELNKTHIHDKLPEDILDKKIKFSNDLDDVVNNNKVIIFAVPSVAFREVADKVFKYDGLADKYLVSLTKGMEDKTLYTMSEILEDELNKNNLKSDKIVVMSGPTHAEEVIKKFPTMIVSASKSMDSAKFMQDLCMNKYFRVYTNLDVKGVEICAGFKNIIALASGTLCGLGFGDNIKAAMITRGLTEMIRVGNVFGCNKDTFYGLAGIGDMIVTATSLHSRNYQFGILIGKGYKRDEALKKVGMVVEGVNFLPKAKQISEKYNLDLPISLGAYEMVINDRDPKEILDLMMTRSKKSE